MSEQIIAIWHSLNLFRKSNKKCLLPSQLKTDLAFIPWVTGCCIHVNDCLGKKQLPFLATLRTVVYMADNRNANIKNLVWESDTWVWVQALLLKNYMALYEKPHSLSSQHGLIMVSVASCFCKNLRDDLGELSCCVLCRWLNRAARSPFGVLIFSVECSWIWAACQSLQGKARSSRYWQDVRCYLVVFT